MEYYLDEGLILQINLKSLCNLDCDYCLLPKHVKSQKETEDVIIDNTKILINKIKEENLTIKMFGVFGAEPFTVKPDIMATVLNLVLDAFPNTFLKVQTNGTLCTEKYMLDFLQIYKYPSRLTIGFSIDGVKELHDEFRCDSWDLAIKNFSWIKNNTAIRSDIICTTNIKHFDNGVNESMLLEFIRIMAINYNTVVGLSYADLTIRNVGDTHIGEVEYSKRFANFLINNDLIFNCIKLFKPQYCYRKGNNCDKILIDLNQGNTYQCEKEFSPDKEFIKWKDHTIAEVMEARHNRTKDYKISEECNSCEYWSWCNGGCPIKRDADGLAKSCYVTKTVLTHIKENVNENWLDYLLYGKVDIELQLRNRHE